MRVEVHWSPYRVEDAVLRFAEPGCQLKNRRGHLGIVNRLARLPHVWRLVDVIHARFGRDFGWHHAMRLRPVVNEWHLRYDAESGGSR